MVYEVRVTDNIADVRKKLTRLQRKQLPFAISLATNNVAFAYRKHVVDNVYPNAFPRARNRRFPAVAFRVEKSTKTRRRAAVYDRFRRYFLDHHIDGRAKRPRGSALAVPVNARRTATGRIRKADTFEGGGDTFVADLQGKGPAIWRRNKRGRLSMLFVLKQQTPVRRTFRFYRIGKQFVRSRFPREFDKALKRALATAR